MEPQNLASAAKAFATLGMRQAVLLDAIAGCTALKLEEFNPQVLTNPARTFAALGVWEERFVRLEESNLEAFAGTAWVSS